MSPGDTSEVFGHLRFGSVQEQWGVTEVCTGDLETEV